MLDLTNIDGQVGFMKVKIGEAKTHLSRLVKEVNATGEPLELCVREETVAYILPAKNRSQEEKEREELEEKLKSSGVVMMQWPQPPPHPCPVRPTEIPLREGNAILEMRAEKDY
jgi:prevent-host-death family protein